MTVVPEYRPGPKVRLPTPETVFGDIDRHLKARAGQNRDDAVQAIRGVIPRRSGRTQAAVQGAVRTARLGYAVTVDTKPRAHVIRWLQSGTGVYGPLHRRIPKGKRGFIRGTGAPSGRGMRPQRTWGKAMRRAEPIVNQMERQMQAAWDDLSRRLG